MSSPIICQVCEDNRAEEVAVFLDGSILALCPKCLEEAGEHIVNTGCLDTN